MKNLLTNRTLAAFEKWYYENHCKSSIKFEDLLLWQKSEVFDWLYSQSISIQHSFLMEFFENIPYTENTSLWEYCFEERYSNCLGSFKHIVEQSFHKANEIFNSKTSHL